MNRFKGYSILLTATLLYVCGFATVAAAVSPAPVALGTSGNFAILAGSAITNTPTSAIAGNIGLSPTTGAAITGFSFPSTCPEVSGTVYAADAAGPACAMTDAAGLTAAKAALAVAYNDAATRSVPAPIPVTGDLGGAILPPGIYKSVAALGIGAGNLTLDGQGDINAVWIFQIGSALTTIGCGTSVPCATGGNVFLINGANAANVFWQVGTAATIGQYTAFRGIILAHDDISVGTGALIVGRLLSGAQPSGAGAVTLLSTTVFQQQYPTDIPTLSEWGMIFMGFLLLLLVLWANKSSRFISRVQIIPVRRN